LHCSALLQPELLTWQPAEMQQGRMTLLQRFKKLAQHVWMPATAFLDMSKSTGAVLVLLLLYFGTAQTIMLLRCQSIH
jgi:hypothetical protein